MEKIYIKKFTSAAQEFVQAISLQRLLSFFPKIVLEGLIFSGVILYLIFFIRNNNNIKDSIPLISIYLIAIYKLMPSLLDLYYSISNIKFYASSLDIIYSGIIDGRDKVNYRKDHKKFSFNKLISINNLFYRYPGSNDYALKDINLTIKPVIHMVFTGFTVQVKLPVDILLGLLYLKKVNFCWMTKFLIFQIFDLGKKILAMYHRVYI